MVAVYPTIRLLEKPMAKAVGFCNSVRLICQIFHLICQIFHLMSGRVHRSLYKPAHLELSQIVSALLSPSLRLCRSVFERFDDDERSDVMSKRTKMSQAKRGRDDRHQPPQAANVKARSAFISLANEVSQLHIRQLPDYPRLPP